MSYYSPQEAAQINWTKRWRKYNIPRPFEGLGLEDVPRTRTNADALAQAHRFVDEFGQRYPGEEAAGDDRSLVGRGLILIGPTGTGKTRLACATATTVHYRYNYSVRYVPVDRYFTKMKDAGIPPEDKQSMSVALLRTPLLIWDDVGQEYDSGSGWNGQQINSILRTRHGAGRPTIVTSNFAPDDWAARYNEALFSFAHEAFDGLSLAGEDMRRAG